MSDQNGFGQQREYNNYVTRKGRYRKEGNSDQLLLAGQKGLCVTNQGITV